MALYLVQHGVSSPKEVDSERGLTERGVAETRRIASVAAGYGVTISGIVHSGRKRARQTAETAASAFEPSPPVSEGSGLGPLDDAGSAAEELRPDSNLMLVGHLPFLGRLLSHLVTGSGDRELFRFQNSGIVCLDRDEGSAFWFIAWALMPRVG